MQDIQPYLMLLWWLLFAHVVADWALQPQWLQDLKGKYAIYMAVHVVTWTGALMIPLMFSNSFAWWKFPFLFAGHWVIDWLKTKKWDPKANTEKAQVGLVHADQSLHMVQVLIVGLL